MVQTKKFEQTFINEYLAWNLHDKDVELRGKKAGLAEGKKAGLAEGVKMTARNMLADGLPREKIARYTGLSPAEVEDLAASR